MTRTHMVIGAALLLTGCYVAEAPAYYEPAPVTVEVVDEYGSKFDEFPLTADGAQTYRAYLKARRGAAYRLRVSNRTGERVGVVLAVDGRNIVSGERSELKSRESMYVLEPWETNDYRGWRTSLDNVHEFYFTEWPDSYAQRTFGDKSAQGVIAMAVFRDRDWQRRLEEERRLQEERRRDELRRNDDASGEYSDRANRAPAPATEDKRAADSSARESSKSAGSAAAAPPPGTGFGERRYDPARRVEFLAESSPMSRSFIKYEWPETLCRKGFGCDDEYSRPRRHNRFWPDDERGFAPYPPSGRR